jgi:hypothetical protein
MAVAYVEGAGDKGAAVWGVGLHSNILTASLRAVVSAANRLPARKDMAPEVLGSGTATRKKVS